MVQSSPPQKRFHLLRYFIAGGVAVTALWMGPSFWGSQVPILASAESIAAGQASSVENSHSLDTDASDSAQSTAANRQVAGSTSGLDTTAETLPLPPGAQAPNHIGIGSSPTPAMLSNGSSLEDQLQAQRSAELRERFPIEDSPSGVSAQPPAAPGLANPHQ